MSRPSLTLAVIILGLAPTQLLAQPADTPQADATGEITAAAQAYVDSFNAQDVEALVGMWTPQGVYLSLIDGETIRGADALRTMYAEILSAEKPPKLTATTNSVEFVSPNVAVERGAAGVAYADGEVFESRYRAVYVRRGDRWLLDRVSEDESAPRPASNYERLAALEPMVGVWLHESDDLSILVNTRWTRNQNFISRTYVVTAGDEVESSGLQVIGWDAATERVVSWMFDSDGGVVTGAWTPRDDRWVVQSVATLADGGRGSFTSVLRPIGENQIGWRKTNRVLDGQLLPNVDEILFTRQ